MKTFPRTCVMCERAFAAKHHRTKYCNPCKANNTHRNGARQRKRGLDRMLVGVDCEGQQGHRNIKTKGVKKVMALLVRQPYMYLRSVSIGREDGSRESYIPTEEELQTPGEAEACALLWLIHKLHGVYIDSQGKKWRQVPVAYHFGWDIATLLKEFKSDKMYLVHKTRTSIETVLCGYHHTPEECHRLQDDNGTIMREFVRTVEDSGEKAGEFKGILHRYDKEDVQTVLGEGGDTDVLAYDPDSQLAIAASPGRRLWVEFRPEGDRFQKGGVPSVDIHDVGRSFVGKFENAIDSWNIKLQPGDRDKIAQGKQAREVGFKGYTTRDIADYSEAECVALALMVRKFLDTILTAVRIKIPDMGLFGSGSVAARALKHYKVPRRKDESDLSFEKMAKLTYFGGLIEAPIIGLIKDITIEPEDINSAYPGKLVQIPCTRAGHGEWIEFDDDNFPRDAHLGHIKAAWFIPRDKYKTEMMPFIDRWDDGTVACPRMAIKPRLVSLAEYITAEKWFKEDIKARGGVYWRQDCPCEPPFAFLREMYDERQRIKSQMETLEKGSEDWWELKVQELAIKLIINSVYGKLAQQKPKMGSYTNLHLASYITGATRAQARDRIWEHEAAGGTLLYVHTDGIKVEGGAPKEETKELNAWGAEETFSSMFIIQPGIAVNVLEAKWNSKKKKFDIPGASATRGVNDTEFVKALQKWLKKVNLTKHPSKWPAIVVKGQRMISRREAEHRGKPWLAGTFKDHTMKLTSATKKRNLEAATQLTFTDDQDPRKSTAWMVPAIDYIPEDRLATAESLDAYRSAMEKRYLTGEFDGHEFR